MSDTHRCTYCGQFYSDRTRDRHRVCQMIEDEQAAEGGSTLLSPHAPPRAPLTRPDAGMVEVSDE